MGWINFKGKSIEEILKKFDPEKKATANKLRTIVKKTLPDAEETIKWGNITYLYNGKNLCWICAYQNHLDFGFFQGAKLKSPLLEGTGKGLRHIKIRTKEDINEKEIGRLLRETAGLSANETI